jgi:hypothetical protein
MLGPTIKRKIHYLSLRLEKVICSFTVATSLINKLLIISKDVCIIVCMVQGVGLTTSCHVVWWWIYGADCTKVSSIVLNKQAKTAEMGGPSTCALGGGQKPITEGIKKAGNEILCRTEQSIQNKFGQRESRHDMAYQQGSSTSSVKTITNHRTNWEIKVKKLYLNNLILSQRFVKDMIISVFNKGEITVIYLAILPLEEKKSGWISKLRHTSFLPN